MRTRGFGRPSKTFSTGSESSLKDHETLEQAIGDLERRLRELREELRVKEEDQGRLIAEEPNDAREGFRPAEESLEEKRSELSLRRGGPRYPNTSRLHFSAGAPHRQDPRRVPVRNTGPAQRRPSHRVRYPAVRRAGFRAGRSRRSSPISQRRWSLRRPMTILTAAAIVGEKNPGQDSPAALRMRRKRCDR
ncbi:MAG: hypothetical protein MZU91_00385 [Desulfosudis oleivorans]|nr:hypothetical protein [Desulfosudis oleivorans]